ncbi:inhibin beta E chain-like [Acanthaster planci]|uniref:Inhibin beta E chain-like n=1 Tax=Acanthaster planci TaxID=133434 RepID=A0A8B7ZK70_ACAPL|nr:inhibin beta E chain-like [Acanthaster planci]
MVALFFQLIVVLSFQLIFPHVHLVYAGVPAGQGYLTVDNAGDQPHKSPEQIDNVKSVSPTTGLIASRQSRSLAGRHVEDLPDDESRSPVHPQKPNDSNKNRSEMRKDFSEDETFNPQPSATSDHFGSGNSSESLSPTPHPSSVVSSSTREDIERRARLEMLKRTFLDQLGLVKPPIVTRPKPEVPAVVLNRLMHDAERNNQRPHRLTNSHPSQLVVFADRDEVDCGPDVAEGTCFRFSVPEQTDNSVVFSSHLWVYITHAPGGASVFVGRPQHHYDSRRRVLASRKLYSREGWVELEIPVDKHKWNRHYHYFEISTKPLQAGGNRTVAMETQHRPMLLLAMAKADRSGRVPRSVGQCTTGQTSCCMRDFLVNFTVIGWDSWIVQPLTFDAHYCAGECSVSSRHFLKDHTEIIALLLQHQEAASDMKLCCVANDVSDLSVIYLGNDNAVRQRYIDVVVENCGCL